MVKGKAICQDFECISDQIGICNYSDEECQGKTCIYWNDCNKCKFSLIFCETDAKEQ